MPRYRVTYTRTHRGTPADGLGEPVLRRDSVEVTARNEASARKAVEAIEREARAGILSAQSPHADPSRLRAMDTGIVSIDEVERLAADA